ncbi:hypothetical protein QCM77_43960 [Bradyrhizobium sp. SSUT18]|uniref:hypothetical protein n=1 Tax=unclassified Bradyrhizobium TaxID=2631580 RepID=UPI00244BDCD4|nr:MULTISPECIES: hypothetical protein [unclassified Bradyrhizobium]MDH2343113.1 hypothetical protein [Bradyrhizobium sp. SSUT77]MDH2353763.1 hypothetical protein [Bradyrhizobium sp. SSUT112]MDH2406744.1 hypothetical protein [Bradyrhizobium sp. SSUT18]
MEHVDPGIGVFLVLALILLTPFVVGSLLGVAFTRLIKRRGWRPQVISVWPISVMFGTLAYVVAPALAFAVLFEFLDPHPLTFLTGLALALFYTWPIWLLMGPVLFIYVTYLKNRRKWLRDSTVAYLSVVGI